MERGAGSDDADDNDYKCADNSANESADKLADNTADKNADKLADNSADTGDGHRPFVGYVCGRGCVWTFC